MENISVSVHSEVGELQGVILHKPGPEVENMTPLNAERALYSDILNLSVAENEYRQLAGILKKVSPVFFVEDLLGEILKNYSVKDKLVRKICFNEGVSSITDDLLDLDSSLLARQLIQGVPKKKDSLTNYLSKNNYSLRPLHNFFFTRDSAVSVFDKVLIAKMASNVRKREAIIMQAIFENHPVLKSHFIDPNTDPVADKNISMEGGDILIARENILLMGIGARSTSQGVDFLLNRLKERKEKTHVIVQELPFEPESFIHLDMVFTFLDRNSCMVYEPLILKPNRFATVHICIENGKVVSINGVKSIPDILEELGIPLEINYCGGRKDSMIQEREQWHSGANFFAIGPGKVLGYSRNVHTLENMNQNGFEILSAQDIIEGKIKLKDYKKYVIAFDGSELSRGGGGARCMTMPVKRKKLS